MTKNWNEWTPARAKWIGGFALIVAVLWIVLPGSPPSKKPDAFANGQTAKRAAWNKAAILKNLEVCQQGGARLQTILKQAGPREAYVAAINLKDECFRAMSEAPDGPSECTTAAMMGLGYYDRLANGIDTLDTRPSVVEGIKSSKVDFENANRECAAALDRQPKSG